MEMPRNIVRPMEFGVECRPERAAGRPGLFDALEVGVAWKLAQGTDSRV